MHVFTSSLLVLVLLVTPVGADAPGDFHPGARQSKSDPLASILDSRRERLRQRLREFVQLEAAEDYRGAFSYFSSIFIASVDGGLTVEAYLKKLPYMRVLRFTPKACIELAPDHFMINGCAEYDRRGPNLRLESGIEAVFERGDWYFSEIETSRPCLHCRPRGCKPGDPL